MRVYALSTNIYKNSCESDNITDVLHFVRELMLKAPLKTQIFISVRDIPDDLWFIQPVFEGWKETSGTEESVE